MRRAWLAGLLAIAACGGGEPPPTFMTAPVVVVPSDGLPAEVKDQVSNNNLDVVRHDGRIYLAFRTAPNHFASSDTVMYVVSSDDEDSWRFETKIAMATDLREPRFLAFGGRLFLYFAVLGNNPALFEPQGMKVTERRADGTWTDPDWFYMPGFIPWRAKVVNGVPYLLTYVGGGNIYNGTGNPLEIHFLTTQDGRNFAPVVAGQPKVLEGGGSETDFVLQDDGSLVAVVRNEAGDATGFGSKICRAEAGDLGNWHCVADPKKYDSPLLFREGADIYLIARRNISPTGNYDLMLRDLPPADQDLTYQIDYWNRPKRCSLWRVDPTALSVSFILDLPSKGDTCFASTWQPAAGQYVVYNYTSPLGGTDDPSWLQGQLAPTEIYRLKLDFSQPFTTSR
ncbi:MAG TPA: hypothetical protein VKE22_15865 [Haliangiales bacterium]|nr:hypothetical protein [Haliangiales bacterium]